MLDNHSTTEISKLGEFGLIKHLTQNIELKNPSTVKGVGDDAAIIDYGGAKMSVVSTDMLVEGVHFDLSYVPLKHLGYKAATVNFSDIFAMNATPKQLLVSIAISSKFSLDAIEEIYSGLLLACERYGVDLVGGDTTASKSGLVISCTIIGEAEKEKIVYRNGAKEKDLLCVTGDLGGAYMGLLMLEREKEVYKSDPNIQPDLEGNDYILERQLKPEARIDIIQMLADCGVVPTSMIDISDGLASELLHLCTQSNVGAQLYEEKIPMDPMTFDRAREFSLDPTMCAMNGGEDFELLFTVDMKDYEKLQHNPDVTFIGHITAKEAGVNLVTRSNTEHPVTAQGWDALLGKDN